MEREALPPKENAAEACPAGLSPSPPEAARRDDWIEDYLDRVCAPLVEVVPYARRRELRAEIAAHLDALVATYQELGSTQDEAVARALQRFGNPREVAAAWAGEWLGPPEDRSVVRAMRTALAFFAPAALALALTLHYLAGWLPASRMPLVPLCLVPPVAAGLATGLRARGRVVLGALGVLSLGTGLAGVVASMLEAQALETGALFAAVMFFFWLPLGCLSAALVGWVRRKALRWGLHGGHSRGGRYGPLVAR